MAPKLFAISNLCWAVLMASVLSFRYLIEMPAPAPAVVAGTTFWLVYLGAAVWTFCDRRTGWVLSIIGLPAVWILMGVAVSERSFLFLTGQRITTDSMPAHAAVVLNSFFGVLVPATILMIILIFCREHVIDLFRNPRPVRRRW